MANLGIGVAGTGILLALATTMLQFLGVSSDALLGALWLQAPLLLTVLVCAASVWRERPDSTAFWSAMPGWFYRGGGLILFVAAVAELAVVMIDDLTGRPAPWLHHAPSALMALYVAGLTWCYVAPRLPRKTGRS